MSISRCRYWRCVECQAVHVKKHLAETIRRQARRDEEVPGHINCSGCGASYTRQEVYVGDYDVPAKMWDELPPPVELPEDEALTRNHGASEKITTSPPRKKRRERAPPEPDEDYEDYEDEEEEEDEKPVERRRRRGRRLELGQVNLGLAIHYGGMLAFLLGQIAGWLAVVLFMGAVFSLGARPEPDAPGVGALLLSATLFLTSWGLTSCSSLADVVSAAFCLRVPDTAARGFLAGALVARLLALPAGLVLVLLGWPGPAMLSTSLLAIIGWALWVAFLRALALCLRQPELGAEAVAITLSAFKLVLGWVVALICLALLLAFLVALARVGGCAVFIVIFSVGVGVAGIMRALILSGKFETITTLVLYPTGIPLIMRYLDLIGTLRTIILRRT
jgi:hypothetical protein